MEYNEEDVKNYEKIKKTLLRIKTFFNMFMQNVTQTFIVRQKEEE